MKKDLNWGNPTLIMHTCAKTPEFNFSFGYSVCILCIWQRRGTVAEFGVLEPTYRILIKLDWTFDFWWTTTYEQITPSVVFLEANRKIVCDISRKIHHLYSSVASILVSCTHETVSIRKGNRWKKATSISKLMLCWNTKSSRDFNSFPEKVYMHIPPLTHSLHSNQMHNSKIFRHRVVKLSWFWHSVDLQLMRYQQQSIK